MNENYIFLANFHSFVTRNILDSDVLQELIKQQKVVVLVDEHKKDYFIKTYAHLKNVVIEGVSIEKIHNELLNIKMERFAELLLDTKVMDYHRMERYEKTGSRLRYMLEMVITKTLGHLKMFKKCFRHFDYYFVQTRAFDELFKKYNPFVVFATDIYDAANVALLHSAKKRKIRTVGMTRSWDNTTTKVYLRTIPDKIITQNDVMKEELNRIHDVPFPRIIPCGVPQFERYLDYQPILREEFCKGLGLDSTKRIVLVCPAAGYFVDTDWQILAILQKLYNERKIPQDIQFLVRPHPYNDTDYSKFTPDKNFVFEENLTVYKGERSKAREEGKANRIHLADTLAHSSLVINTFSSIIVDAVICDKPVISIGFDGWENEVPFLRSLARWQTEECVVYFFSHGASPLVRSSDELAEWINTYLQHPETHRTERRKFAETHMWKMDGKASERIAQLLLNEACCNK